jgi:thioredoxin-related protein
MKTETYTDPRVAAAVMADFVPVSVNTTQEPRLAADYYVRGLPTIWFLGSDGAKITALPGYVDAPMFLKVLRYIATRSYEKMDFKAFLDAGS